LAKKNLFIADATIVPGSDGSYANGQTAYLLSTGELRTFLDILDLAQ
jgi:hypothetical protein